MPKNEILHPAGHSLPPELRENLLRYFKDSHIQKLERHGGRILISITAPYTNRKTKTRRPVEIDHRFVKKLEKLKNSPSKIQDALSALTVKELRLLGDLVGQPFRSSASANEIRSDLTRYFNAESVWQRISTTKRKKR